VDSDDVFAHIVGGIRLGRPGTVGAELEWFVVDEGDPCVRPGLDRVARAIPTVLPAGSAVTTEPGGQLELSCLPQADVAAAVAALSDDVAAARTGLARDGLLLTGLGADPLRPAERLVRSARYDAMEAHFTALGPDCAAAGRTMMCSSAAVQVSLDAGQDGGGVQGATERWQRAHAVGPALVAAFACSPLLEGAPTGWMSTRQRSWAVLDPARTAPPPAGLGPAEACTAMALSARPLRGPGAGAASFGAWLATGSATVADLEDHLTTLFPPVRVRGWYELRYLDALPDPYWRVAVAVATAVLDDDVAADAARAACAPVEGRWRDAARQATADAELARAAKGCLQAAIEALPRLGAPGLARETAGYLERFTARGRCPADDLLDAHRAGTPAARLLTAPGLVEGTA